MRSSFWGALVLAAGLTMIGPLPSFAADSPVKSRQPKNQETEDTVVADDGDSRPAFAESVDEPSAGKSKNKSEKPVAKGKVSGPRATPKDRFALRDAALELADPRTYRLKVVIRIKAEDGPVKDVVATGPIPMNWPEQEVRLLSEKLSPHARCTETVLKGQAALIKFQVAQIAQGETAFVERLYEITRYRTKFVLPGAELKLPRGVPVELKDQVAGVPPGVEIQHPKMIELATTLKAASQQEGPYDLVKTFWSWTRDNVKFENGDFRGAMHAIEERCGDCEEMSALFVGLCRLSNIPARTVWVESHDYPEFYLLDEHGKGHWIPCQVLGPAWFGEITEYRPILQKGDRFYDPLQKEYVRYVPQTVKGSDGKALPKVEFQHEIIADSDINGPSYTNSK